MYRRWVWMLLVVMCVAFAGCGSSEPEYPPDAIPKIPPGRGSRAPGPDGGDLGAIPEPPK